MSATAESLRTTGLSSRTSVEERIRDANERLSTLDDELQRIVRKKPMTSALVALAVGFILGRIVSRA
jgi:ElaB/YqjD/DUF883 family membrane-anchored ribosome-binding protein